MKLSIEYTVIFRTKSFKKKLNQFFFRNLRHTIHYPIYFFLQTSSYESGNISFLGLDKILIATFETNGQLERKSPFFNMQLPGAP